MPRLFLVSSLNDDDRKNKVVLEVDVKSELVIMGGLLGARQLAPAGTERKRKVNGMLTS